MQNLKTYKNITDEEKQFLLKNYDDASESQKPKKDFWGEWNSLQDNENPI